VTGERRILFHDEISEMLVYDEMNISDRLGK